MKYAPRAATTLQLPMTGLNDLLLSLLQVHPVVQNARENQKQWSERLEKAEREESGSLVQTANVPDPA